MGYTERNNDHSEGVREDMGDMGRYWSITEGTQKKVYPHKPLPISYATNAISLVSGTWDISRFESVPGLLNHPTCFLTCATSNNAN
jgi:hypothetical protein